MSRFAVVLFFFFCLSTAQLDDGESILGALPRVSKGFFSGIAKALNLVSGVGKTNTGAADGRARPKGVLARVVTTAANVAGGGNVGSNVASVIGKVRGLSPETLDAIGMMVKKLSPRRVILITKRLVTVYQSLQRAAAAAGIDKKAGRRTGLKLLSALWNLVSEMKLLKPIFQTAMGGPTFNWRKYEQTLEDTLLSKELSKQLIDLGQDQEVLGVMDKFMRTYHGQDPHIVESLRTAYNFEIVRVNENGRISIATLLGRSVKIRKNRDVVFSLMANDGDYSELMVQMFRARYRRWRDAWRTLTLIVQRNIPELTKFVENMPLPQREVTACHLTKVFSPFSMPLCRYPRPAYEVAPLLVVFGTLIIASAVAVVLGLLWKSASRFHIVILACLFASCALRLTFYSFWAIAIGEGFTSDDQNFTVSFVASHVVERFAALLFATVGSIFAFVLVRANFDAFFPEKKKIFFVLTIAGIAVIGAVAVYSVAMVIVVSLMRTSENIVDMSRLLLAATSALFSLAVVAGFVVTWLSVRKDPALRAALNRTLLFLAGSCILAIMFVLSLVFTSLYMFVNLSAWGEPYFFTTAAAEALLGAAVLCYCFLAIFAQRVPTQKGEQKFEERPDEAAVPLLYSNY